jgi:hypothetical protein
MGKLKRWFISRVLKREVGPEQGASRKSPPASSAVSIETQLALNKDMAALRGDAERIGFDMATVLSRVEADLAPYHLDKHGKAIPSKRPPPPLLSQEPGWRG